MVLLIGAAGCAARGPYVEPAVAPTVMRNAASGLVVEQPFDMRWWMQFDDPVLDQLVTQGLSTNHDVRISVARVQQARAVFDEARRDRFPTVGAGASVERRDQVVPGFTEEPQGLTIYQAGFDAFWELDLFGRVRSQIRAAAATAQSFEATADDVRVSVAAEDRAELLRDSRPSAAIGRRRTQPGEPAGNVAAGSSAARRRVW